MLERRDTKECHEFCVFSILYNNPLQTYGKSKFKIGDRARISQYDMEFRKNYKPQFTPKVFGDVAIASRALENFQHTQKDIKRDCTL